MLIIPVPKNYNDFVAGFLPLLRKTRKDHYGYVVRKHTGLGFTSCFIRSETYFIGFEYSAQIRNLDSEYCDIPNDAYIRVFHEGDNFGIRDGIFHVLKHYKDALEIKKVLEETNPHQKYLILWVEIPRGTYYISGKTTKILKNGYYPSYGTKRIIHLREIKNAKQNNG